MGDGLCFVIQPFDGGEFDARFDEVIAPAIREAGLQPYRVDRDPETTIAIEMIHAKIVGAEAIVADISLDNPNVWYELGYSLAVGHTPVMLCKEPRPNSYPFDVRHRIVLRYTTTAPADFEKLRVSLVERLTAPSYRTIELHAFSKLERTEISGLEKHEFDALVTIAAAPMSGTGRLSEYEVGEHLLRQGYSPLAARLALEALRKSGLVESRTETNYQNDYYEVVDISDQGLNWLLSNKDHLNLVATELSVNASPPAMPRAGPPAYNPDEEPF